MSKETQNVPTDEQAAGAILQRLAATFEQAALWANEKAAMKIHLVIVGSVGDPIVQDFATVEELCSAVGDLKRQSKKIAGMSYRIFVFYGHQWLLAKGPRWSIFDGKSRHLLDTGSGESEIDESGLLDDPDDGLPPDDVVVAPEDWVPASSTDGDVSNVEDSEIPLVDSEEEEAEETYD